MQHAVQSLITKFIAVLGRQYSAAGAASSATLFFSTNNQQTNNSSSAFSHNARRPSFNFKKQRKTVGMALAAIVVLAIVVLAFQRIAAGRAATGSASILPVQTNVQDAKATLELNREFSFPLRDQDGKEVSQIQVTLLNAQLRDEIIVRGRRAKTLANRDFLTINIKITNDFNRTIQLSMRDYLRLSVNGTDEKFAPEIHNDPVEVQAISTKITRVGFPVNESDKDIILQVGEVNGEKETIRLEFN